MAEKNLDVRRPRTIGYSWRIRPAGEDSVYCRPNARDFRERVLRVRHHGQKQPHTSKSSRSQLHAIARVNFACGHSVRGKGRPQIRSARSANECSCQESATRKSAIRAAGDIPPPAAQRNRTQTDNTNGETTPAGHVAHSARNRPTIISKRPGRGNRRIQWG